MHRPLGLILLSFVLTFFLWIYAKTERRYTVNLSVPVVVEDLDTTRYVLRRVDPEHVVLRVRLQGRTLMRLHWLPPRAVFSLKGRGKGTYVLPLQLENLTLPEDMALDILELRPNVVRIELDRVVRRRLRPRVEVDSALRVLRIEPSRVRVRGPSLELDSLRRIPYHLTERPQMLPGETLQVWAIPETLPHLRGWKPGSLRVTLWYPGPPAPPGAGPPESPGPPAKEGPR